MQSLMEVSAVGGRLPRKARRSMMERSVFLGLDIGSTTAKLALVAADGKLLEAQYLRHGAAVRQTLSTMLDQLALRYPGMAVSAAITGSASLGLSETLGLPFVQEVVAASRAIAVLAPQTDVAVELGGEDAKILYLSQGMDLRMNEACAGGTGAFIDQMAALLHTDASGLNELAANYTTLYPIASRCGVFAKTDVVPLLNEGAAREDLAASIFQAVVEQTIGGLACGNPIRGKVAFLGGPLHFLPELRKRFIATLKLAPEEVVPFPNAQYMVALGTALSLVDLPGAARMADMEPVTLDTLAERARVRGDAGDRTASLPPLFDNEADYDLFRERHNRDAAPRKPLESASGPLFLGVDLGSTTVKAVLADAGGAVLTSWYERNQGDPLAGLLPYLADLIDSLPEGAWVQSSVATGYGAQLAQAALGSLSAEVETVAHLKAACRLVPDATYVIDIGGQDMKCLKARDGLIAGVTLNEACSAGCGAFLEMFARSLNLSMEAFVRAALFARHPVDLGSRCTVFMNSKVKQAQKEGADIGDIAAGLCYAVARNALYKVLRLRTPAELGDRVLVQGGSFLNDALLRVMERLLDHHVCRPDIAGLMGAYGAALLARSRTPDGAPPTPLTSASLRSLNISAKTLRCKGCGNHCLLTVNRFSNGRKLVSGNRCERGASGGEAARPSMPNLYAWKERRLFGYEPLPQDDAPRGRIGIPRVLNMYEHYPFWFTLFTELGYRVELSPPSGKELFDLGLSSMPSQTVCYPAKLAHGHIASLLRKGLKRIFFPCLPRERRESKDAADGYNCPVVAGYPEVIRLNTDELLEQDCTLYTPFVSLEHPDTLVAVLHDLFGIPKKELRAAVRVAALEQEAYRTELRAEGERVLAELERTGKLGIVLSGRPYHADPAVHHGLPELVASLGAAVLSEDSVAHLGHPAEPLRVVDQWTYHSRLYRATALVCTRPNLELVQLTSFGCGLDAITADQVSELLTSAGKLHTLIKIDEGASLGAARIRIRSLLAAVEERRGTPPTPRPAASAFRPVFTRPMRQTHTILAPQMSPLHFDIIGKAISSAGYNLEILPTVSREAIETGLNYVHNDACYPAIVVIGQLIDALQSGRCDPKRTALMLAQTCGPCRATNYPALLRKALCEAGFGDVPVLTLSGGSLNNQPGFAISVRLLHRLILSCLYGDMLQRVSLSTRAHERNAGDTDDLLAHWMNRVKFSAARGDSSLFKSHMRSIVRDFSAIRQNHAPLPRVGIVGEILLKYHPDANNQVIRHITEEGGEPVLTDLMDFFLYCLLDPVYLWRHMGGKAFPAFSNWLLIKRIESLRDAMRRALEGSRFLPVSRIADLARSVHGIVSTGNQAGEGWLLTAEMLELIDHGVGNVLCLQPFGCLPNHITGKGVLKELKRIRPHANLMAVDYDPGSSEANQLNRIKLFMTVAHSRIPQEAQGDHAPASLNESVAQLAGRLRDNLKGKLENTLGGSGNSGDEVTNLA